MEGLQRAEDKENQKTLGCIFLKKEKIEVRGGAILHGAPEVVWKKGLPKGARFCKVRSRAPIEGSGKKPGEGPGTSRPGKEGEQSGKSRRGVDAS